MSLAEIPLDKQIQKILEKNFPYLTITKYTHSLYRGTEWTIGRSKGQNTTSQSKARNDRDQLLLVRQHANASSALRVWHMFPWRGERDWINSSNPDLSRLNAVLISLKSQAEQSFISLLHFTHRVSE